MHVFVFLVLLLIEVFRCVGYIGVFFCSIINID